MPTAELNRLPSGPMWRQCNAEYWSGPGCWAASVVHVSSVASADSSTRGRLRMRSSACGRQWAVMESSSQRACSGAAQLAVEEVDGGAIGTDPVCVAQERV